MSATQERGGQEDLRLGGDPVRPTLIGTVYGMKFDYMPELHWLLGYPFALALMVLISVGLWVVFKRRDWI